MLTARLPRTFGGALGRIVHHPGLGRAVGALVAVALLGRLVDAPIQALHGVGADYVSFATGARILASGSTCLYCVPAQEHAQASVLGYWPPASWTGFPHIYVNPPLAAWLLQPVAALPLASGLGVFVVASVAALFAAARVLERRLPRSLPEDRRRLLLIAATASLPAATAVMLGQWDPFILLATAGALWALESRRPVTAGLLLSVLLVKPQLVWLLLPLLVAARAWRLAAGFSLGAIAWLASSLLLVGPRQLAQVVSLVRTHQTDEGPLSAGLPALAGHLGGDAVLVAAALCAAAALAVTWRQRALLRRSAPAVTVSLGTCASMVCAPHVFSDDLLLLAVPLVVLATRWHHAAIAAAIGLSAAFILDEWVVHLGPRWAEAAVVLAVAACLVRTQPAAPAGVPGDLAVASTA